MTIWALVWSSEIFVCQRTQYVQQFFCCERERSHQHRVSSPLRKCWVSIAIWGVSARATAFSTTTNPSPPAWRGRNASRSGERTRGCHYLFFRKVCKKKQQSFFIVGNNIKGAKTKNIFWNVLWIDFWHFENKTCPTYHHDPPTTPRSHHVEVCRSV